MKVKEGILEVALTLDMNDIPESLLRFLHELPPIEDPIRECRLTTGLITIPEVKFLPYIKWL